MENEMARYLYSGKQELGGEYVFCPHCLDSPYLTVKDLHLTRMTAIDREWEKRAPLTEAEEAQLLPLYKEAQTKGSTERGKARLAKMRADVVQKYDRGAASARTERDGFLWLLDHGVGAAVIENCIYYTHTNVFSFGWRGAMDAVVVSAVLEWVSEFPFAYEIKCADGRKLEGGKG